MCCMCEWNNIIVTQIKQSLKEAFKIRHVISFEYQQNENVVTEIKKKIETQF